MSRTETRYRRLLRWYPRSWRRADHDVLLHTLLADAAASGRSGPTAAETVSIVLHGTAQRFDHRAAVVAAATATAFSVLSWLLLLLPGASGSPLMGGTTIPMDLLVVPPLVLVAAAALLRTAGAIGARRTLLLPGLGAVAGVAGAVAVVLWALAFDAADAGRALPPATGVTTAAALVIAWAAVGALVGIVVSAVLRAAGLPATARSVVAVLVGLPAAPLLGIAFLQPGGAVLCSAGVLALALLIGRSPGVAPVPRRPAPAPRPGVPGRAASVLAVSGTAGALAAAVFAFAGGPLAAFGLDGTGAMRAGLGVGALAGVPVAVAAARLGVGGRPFPRSALVLVVAALLLNAAAQLRGPSADADGTSVLLMLLAALLGGALALLVHPALPGTPGVRAVLASLVGLVFTATVGVWFAVAAGFAVPFAGAVVAVRATRRTRPSAAPAAA